MSDLVANRKALRLAITDTLRGRSLTAEEIAAELVDVAPRNRVETEILRLVGSMVVCGVYQRGGDRAQRYELFDDVVARLKKRAEEERGSRRSARPSLRRAERVA